MNLDISALTNTMTEAVRGAIGERWSMLREFAEPELQKLAQTLETVNQYYAAGKIDQGRAWDIVEIQRNTALTVLRGVQGIGLLTARGAVDAAARAAGEVVNRLLGFKVI